MNQDSTQVDAKAGALEQGSAGEKATRPPMLWLLVPVALLIAAIYAAR